MRATRWTKMLLICASAGWLLWSIGGCTITPHANVGVGLNYHGGSFHLNPYAGVGLWGRP